MTKQPHEPAGEDAANILISFAEAAKISGLTPSHLRRLAINKKIWAIKLGRDWATTKTAIQEYLETDRRTGPKSHK